MDAYAIGCGVLATIEQWYPTRKFNGTMVHHKRNSKVWPGLVTKEKTMRYPTSAMCTVCVGPPESFYMWDQRSQTVVNCNRAGAADGSLCAVPAGRGLSTVCASM